MTSAGELLATFLFVAYSFFLLFVGGCVGVLLSDDEPDKPECKCQRNLEVVDD